MRSLFDSVRDRIRKTLGGDRAFIRTAVLLLVVILPASADFAAGKLAYEQKDYATALREWTAAAEQGDARSQFALGSMHMWGEGTTQDRQLGASWWWQAAKNGDEQAQRYVAWPFTETDQPRLTLAAENDWLKPRLPPDGKQRLDFTVTLHGMRPIVERMVLDAENYEPDSRKPNLSVTVYRVEGLQRFQQPAHVYYGGVNGSGGVVGLSTDAISFHVEIPALAEERQPLLDQLTAVLDKTLLADPDKAESHKSMLRFLRTRLPNGETGLDRLLGSFHLNRAGVYEVVCSYLAKNPLAWSGALVSDRVLFEVAPTPDWLSSPEKK